LKQAQTLLQPAPQTPPVCARSLIREVCQVWLAESKSLWRYRGCKVELEGLEVLTLKTLIKFNRLTLTLKPKGRRLLPTALLVGSRAFHLATQPWGAIPHLRNLQARLQGAVELASTGADLQSRSRGAGMPSRSASGIHPGLEHLEAGRWPVCRVASS
jgi:hypothetical protein